MENIQPHIKSFFFLNTSHDIYTYIYALSSKLADSAVHK